MGETIQSLLLSILIHMKEGDITLEDRLGGILIMGKY